MNTIKMKLAQKYTFSLRFFSHSFTYSFFCCFSDIFTWYISRYFKYFPQIFSIFFFNHVCVEKYVLVRVWKAEIACQRKERCNTPSSLMHQSYFTGGERKGERGEKKKRRNFSHPSSHHTLRTTTDFTHEWNTNNRCQNTSWPSKSLHFPSLFLTSPHPLTSPSLRSLPLPFPRQTARQNSQKIHTTPSASPVFTRGNGEGRREERGRGGVPFSMRLRWMVLGLTCTPCHASSATISLSSIPSATLSLSHSASITMRGLPGGSPAMRMAGRARGACKGQRGRQVEREIWLGVVWFFPWGTFSDWAPNRSSPYVLPCPIVEKI